MAVIVELLAKQSGVPQTTLSRFMRGNDMGIVRAAKICKVLGLDLVKRKQD